MRYLAACMLAMVMTVGLPRPATASFNPFASQVIDTSLNPGQFPQYRPAPGQFINDPNQEDYMLNDPAEALGAPSGAGVFAADNRSMVSLGWFGGSLTLAFDHDVEDHPANPMGLDAIVFGNATWFSGSDQLHWAEQGVIEIMPELNGDGVPASDPAEKWYLIPGSQLGPGSTRTTATWIESGGTQPPGSYPAFTGWPTSYDTTGYDVQSVFEQINGIIGIQRNPNFEDGNPDNDAEEGIWGYADFTPTIIRGDRDGDGVIGTGDDAGMAAELFYTTPDDPLTVGITPGAGGGDAFDIAWAVDPQTWTPANLNSFRYIRITTANDDYLGPNGEVSTEIDAVADVRPIPDLDGDNQVAPADHDAMLASLGSEWGQPGFLPTADIVVDAIVDQQDYDAFGQAWSLAHPGDFDWDTVVQPGDIDLLWQAVYGASSELRYDLDGDGNVTAADVTYLVEQVRGTQYGDLDLDGQVSFLEAATTVANIGLADAGWANGDLDGSGEVEMSDAEAAVAALDGNPAGLATSVPEPSSMAVLVLLTIGGLARQTRRR